MINVFYFEVGDQADWFRPEGCLAIEARKLEDAQKIANYILPGTPRHLDSDAPITTLLGEVARVKEDKANEVLRFLYERSQS